MKETEKIESIMLLASRLFQNDDKEGLKLLEHLIENESKGVKAAFKIGSRPNPFFNSRSASKEELIKFMNEKYPAVDIEKFMNLFEEEVAKIELTGPDDNHPNKDLRMPINSDFVKVFTCSLIEKYNKTVV